MRLLALLPALALSDVLLAQTDGWIPPAHARRAGNNGFAMPGNWSSGRIQCIFDAADLPAGFTPGKLVNRVAYRRSSYPSLVNDTYSARTYTDCTVSVGNTPTPGSGLTVTFATNIPADVTTVLANATINFAPAPPIGALEEVSPDTLVFPFTTPKLFTGPNLFLEHINASPVNVTIVYWLDMLDNRSTILNGHNAVRGRHGCGEYGPIPTNLRAPIAASANALGGTTVFTLANATINTSFLLTLGFQLDNPYGLPAPFDLAALGAPGCPFWNTIDVLYIGATAATGAGAVTVAWPSDPSLNRLEVGLQALVISPGFNAVGLTTSNGIAARIGGRYPSTSASVLGTPHTVASVAAANLYIGGHDITHIYWQ